VAESTLDKTGFGLFALYPIPKGTVIGVYTGEQIDRDNDEDQYHVRAAYKELNPPSYLYDMVGQSAEDELQGFVDALSFGNMTRFANHHRTVNLTSHIYYSHYGKVGNSILFVAKTPIKEGQELFLNYGSTFFNKPKKAKKVKKSEPQRKRKTPPKVYNETETESDYSESSQEASTDASC
jgi:histone-lysine N-methyltransferase SUV39H